MSHPSWKSPLCRDEMDLRSVNWIGDSYAPSDAAEPLMSKAKRSDSERERRIEMEIVVDAYHSDERAMGWYYYLEGKLSLPFTARCTTRRAISPLQVNDEVEVVGMPPEEECYHEMFVTIRWDKSGLAVPLSQLNVMDADRRTREAVEDWHYWVRQRYEF